MQSSAVVADLNRPNTCGLGQRGEPDRLTTRKYQGDVFKDGVVVAGPCLDCDGLWRCVDVAEWVTNEIGNRGDR